MTTDNSPSWALSTTHDVKDRYRRPHDTPRFGTFPVDTTHAANWPSPLGEAAMRGLVGEFVRAVEPHTESDPAALHIQFLAAYGSVIGRGAHFMVEATHHYLNLYAALVGPTAKARKGTSLQHVRNLFARIDPTWQQDRISSGLNSGEGLVWAVRDPIYDKDGEVADAGVDDKRLLVVESEFASVLRVLNRDGNTLSPTLRRAWDGDNLQSMTRNSAAKATEPHVSLIAHISQPEVTRYLDRTESANGFGNRFLWVCTKRSKLLPDGGHPNPDALADTERRLREAVEFGRRDITLTRDEECGQHWREIYEELSGGRLGLFGSLTARAEAQVMRLACIYAALDMSYVVLREHLEAALEVWRYCSESALNIFGDSVGNPVADLIRRELQNRTEGMTRTEIRDFFGRNKQATEVAKALGILVQYGMARWETEKVPGGGRPTERWFACGGASM